MREYQHVFFDLDHTLWDFDANAEEALTELFVEFDLENILKIPFHPFYEKYIHHNKILWDRYHHGYIGADELKWKRMYRTLLDFKIGNELLSKTLSERFLEILPFKKKVFPYTIEILDYLLAKNYAIHLITNGFHNIQSHKLKSSGLDKYFQYIITSESSNSLKPKKEIFDYALKAASAELSTSIMIGDNIDADIQGAINAGMDSIFVNHTGEEICCNATFTITHLQQIESIL